MDLEDDLKWLAGHAYDVVISKHADRWCVMLLGPGDNWEMGGPSFDGPENETLVPLLGRVREWAETPLARDLDGQEWLRLSQAASKLGTPARDLIRRGARELLDRLDREAGQT